MNIVEIKAAISAKTASSIGTLSMVRQYDERALLPTEINVTVKGADNKEVLASFDPANPAVVYNVKTVWVSHWDNDHRVRITMHEDIMNQLRSNPAKADLATKYELVKPFDKAAYHRFVIITPRDVEATF